MKRIIRLKCENEVAFQAQSKSLVEIVNVTNEQGVDSELNWKSDCENRIKNFFLLDVGQKICLEKWSEPVNGCLNVELEVMEIVDEQLFASIKFIADTAEKASFLEIEKRDLLEAYDLLQMRVPEYVPEKTSILGKIKRIIK